MEHIESADEKAGGQTRRRNAQEDEQNPQVTPRFVSLGEQIEAQTHQRRRYRDQRVQSDETIEHDREQSARVVIGSFFEQEIALNNIAARAARQELVVKHPDQK